MPTLKLGVTGRSAKTRDEEEVVESLGGHLVDLGFLSDLVDRHEPLAALSTAMISNNNMRDIRDE